MDRVTIRCPECSRTLKVRRDISDPLNAIVVEMICDKCDTGDFAEVLYFDVNGNQILDF